MHKLNVEFMLNNNRGKEEETKTRNSTEFALNKRDNDDISSEERVSRNLYAATYYPEKRNSGKNRGMLDVEEWIQDTHNVLIKNLLSSNKLSEFLIERRVAADGYVYPNFDTK